MQLAAQCGDGVPPDVLAGINRTESQYNTLAININRDGKGETVRGIETIAQAKAKVRQLIDAGINFDAGIMQLNVKNWDWMGINVDSVFDPCHSIRAAAMLLKSFGKYNAGGDGQRGIRNGYAGKTWNNVQAVSRETLPAASSQPVQPQCTIPKPSRFDGWGMARWKAKCSLQR